MTNANLMGKFQNPVKAIEAKLDEYFTSNGFKKFGGFDADGISDGDYGYEVRGTIDDLHIQVAYYNFKPRKKVMREIMALDERISDVDVYRHLSPDKFENKLGELLMEPIYVMIDGELMQTNMFEYLHYTTRNIDYTKTR